MINIVTESGGCHSDIFEGKGEVARVALMWLFPSTPPPPAAASDEATERSVRWQSLPPLAHLFSGQPRPFAQCFATVEGAQAKEKEFVLWEDCTAEDHRPQSERMVPMPLSPSSLFSIYYQVTGMETLCTQQQLQGKAGREEKAEGTGMWFTKVFSAFSSFPFYCHVHPWLTQPRKSSSRWWKQWAWAALENQESSAFKLTRNREIGKAMTSTCSFVPHFPCLSQ